MWHLRSTLASGPNEYLSNSTQTIQKYAIPIKIWPQMTGPAFFHYFSNITASGLWPLIDTYFQNLWPRMGSRYWGWTLELIWYHFDKVVIWPLRSTLVGLIEDFSKSTLTTLKFLIPTNFSLLCPILECVRFSMISAFLWFSVMVAT